MWTFSTLGWPDTTTAISGKPDSIQKKGDLAKFHPTNVLETGYEIITLWVSRMIMMSLFALNEVPFKNVYLHGMVLDAQGKKMSKSKGNGLDPVEVSKQYGNDAVRLSLLLGNTPGVDVRLSEEKIASSRNFTNKLWNISRYIMSQSINKEFKENGALTIADRWIQSRLQKIIEIVTQKIKAQDFSGAGEALREFTLDDLADWYLEASKFEKFSQAPVVLKKVLESILKLWHPFMPFVTEVIWKELQPEANLLLITNWPKEESSQEDMEAEDSFALIQSIITLIRNVRSEHRIEPGQKLKTIIYTGDRLSVIENCREIITSLRTGVGELEIKKQGDVPLNSLLAATQGIEIYIEAQIDTEAERLRLTKEIEYVQKGISSIEKKLANPEFKNNAPELIFKQEEKKLTDYQLSFEKLSQQLKDLPKE
jgi:valyl-tRNA synthetase